MDDHPTASQAGHEFADDMLQLLGGDHGQLTLPQSMEYPVLPNFQGLSQQSSLGLLQKQTASSISSWPARRAVGGFTGPPVETGATLPYRDPPRPAKYGQKSLPAAGISRSVTSGAGQIQSGLHASNPSLTAAPLPTIPSTSSVDPQRQSFAAAHTDDAQPLAHELVQAASRAAMPHLLAGMRSHPATAVHQSMAAGQGVPSGHGLTGAHHVGLPMPFALRQPAFAGSLSVPPQMLMASSPFQHFVLRGPDQAGASAFANESAPLTQALDSLNSTASKVRTKLTAGTDLDVAQSSALPDDPNVFLAGFKDDPDEQDNPVGADKPPYDAEGQQRPIERNQPVGNASRENRPNTNSNQSTRSHQERHQENFEAGQSGSDGYHFAWNGGNASKDVQDGGSDSADTYSKDGKRSRGDSSGVQGSGTDAGPNPRAKKIKVQMGDEMQDAPEGRNLTEAERRRIRRRVTNRESAKRIRDKREEQMTLMGEQVAKLEAHKSALVGHMHSVEDCCAQLMEQLKCLKEKWCATCVENVKLYKKIFELRKALNPGATSAHLAGQIGLAEECPNLPAAPAAGDMSAAQQQPSHDANLPDTEAAAHSNSSAE